jgi:5-methylcytosine-specific restriction endonuclease McrA
MKRKRPWFTKPREHPFRQHRDHLPEAVRIAVIDRQRGQCAICRCLLGPSFTEIDHHPPLALRSDQNEPHDPALLQALCSPCHNIKTRGDLRQIAKTKRQALREKEHQELIAMKVPGRPRAPAAVRKWRLRAERDR